MNAIRTTVAGEPRLERGPDGQLRAWLNGRAHAVAVRRCFPWSAPGRFISLEGEGRREVALIEDPGELDARSRALLELELAAAGFLLEILAIEAIDEEVEIRSWTVETRNGRRRFQTKRDEWPRPVQGGLILIRDVAGDLYCIREPAALDRASRNRLSAYID